MSLRSLLRTLHLFLGLTAGALVAFIGLTGTTLAFRAEVDRALHPRLFYGGSAGTAIGVERVLAAVERGHPGAVVTMVAWPRAPREAFVVDLADGREVFVDAAEGRLLGERVANEAPMERLLALHRTLLAGEAGRTVVGVASLVLLVILLSGWVIWWPRRVRQLPARLAIRRGQVAFGLHGALGVFATVTLVLAVLSGTAFTFKRWSIPLLAAMTGSPVITNSSPVVAEAPGATRLGPERAVAAAQARYPEGRLMALRLPRKPQEAYKVDLRQPGDPHPYGRSLVWVDPYAGTVLRALDPASAPAGWRLYYVFAYPVHTGEWLGLPGRWLMLASGLSPAVLLGTGWWLWRRKRRRPRREAASRVPAAIAQEVS